MHILLLGLHVCHLTSEWEGGRRKTEDRKTEDRRQKTEDKGRKTEVGDQRSAIRGR